MNEGPERPEAPSSSQPPGRWERWLAIAERENELNAAALRAAREEGPLNALQRFSRGELGGPLSTAVIRRVPYVFALNRWQYPLFVYLGPLLVGYTFLLLTDEALDASLGWRLLLAAGISAYGLAAGAGAYALALRSTRKRVLGLVGRWSREDLWFLGALLVILPTVAFASVSAFLVHEGSIGVKGASQTDRDLTVSTFETFLWNLADAVPVLKVPKTRDWEPALKFTTMTGGALVLAYKLLLVLPLAQLAAIGIAGLLGDKPEQAADEDAVSPEGGTDSQ